MLVSIEEEKCDGGLAQIRKSNTQRRSRPRKHSAGHVVLGWFVLGDRDGDCEMETLGLQTGGSVEENSAGLSELHQGKQIPHGRVASLAGWRRFLGGRWQGFLGK